MGTKNEGFDVPQRILYPRGTVKMELENGNVLIGIVTDVGTVPINTEIMNQLSIRVAVEGLEKTYNFDDL